MPGADIGLGSPITIAFGQTLKFQSILFDAINQRITGTWQTFDGTNLTGRTFSATITPSGTYLNYTDGTSSFDASLTYGMAGPQSAINQAAILAFGNTRAK
jgi:hypothetical protein